MKKFSINIERLESRKLLSVAPNDPSIHKPVVAVIDSGLDVNHEALKSYVWTNPNEIPNNNIDDDHDGYIDDINGWNFNANNNIVQDGYGHGTSVGGIIASYGPVSLMVLKFQNDSGVGFTGDAISAINYAIMMKKNYGIDVVAINEIGRAHV